MNVDGDKGIMEIPLDHGNGGFWNPESGLSRSEESLILHSQDIELWRL